MNDPNQPFDRSTQPLQPENFTSGKEWYDSSTIRANLTSFATAVVPLIVMAMAAFGRPVDAEAEEMIASFFLQLISMGFVLGGIRGRLKAREEIKPVTRKKPPGTAGSAGFTTTYFVVVLTGILLLTLLFFGAKAQAMVKDAVVSFEAPTKRADGSALPPSEIKHYLIKWKGPNNTSGTVITTDEKSLLSPPKVGEYTITVLTVDTEGRTSDPSTAVQHAATEVPPGSAPLPPTFTATPTSPTNGSTLPPLVTVEGLRVLAQSHMNNTGWLQETVDERKVIKAPPGPLNTSDPSQNASVDYLVSTDGGAHTVSFHVFAPDGLSDSLLLGLNGAPAPAFNNGRPVFFPTFNRWVRSTPMPIELPAGPVTITLFAREPGLMVSDIELKKVAL